MGDYLIVASEDNSTPATSTSLIKAYLLGSLPRQGSAIVAEPPASLVSTDLETSEIGGFWMCLPYEEVPRTISYVWVQPVPQQKGRNSTFRLCSAKVIGEPTSTFFVGIKLVDNIGNDTLASSEILVLEKLKKSIKNLPGAPVAAKIMNGKTIYVMDRFDLSLHQCGSLFAPHRDDSPEALVQKELRLARFCCNAVKQVAYLHSIGVVHRDLKPANFAVNLSTFEVAVIDYQSAALLGVLSAELGSGGVTPSMAPKVLRCEDTYSAEYDFACLARSIAAILQIRLGRTLTLQRRNAIEETCKKFPNLGLPLIKVIFALLTLSSQRFPGDKLESEHLSTDSVTELVEQIEKEMVERAVNIGVSQHPLLVPRLPEIPFVEKEHSVLCVLPPSGRSKRKGSSSSSSDYSVPKRRKQLPPSTRIRDLVINPNMPISLPPDDRIIEVATNGRFAGGRRPTPAALSQAVQALHAANYTEEAMETFWLFARVTVECARHLFLGVEPVPKFPGRPSAKKSD